ncbi:OsmC family protein [Siccirubricoccus sp. KC 17139]|uniref:OsmC family protein n=1 Tax=Siccirubricoccus soli TaxID=2899147 RepID=A0ABT1D3J0_9PROT|nr:OsmC family protein [Siccirubricoccus soli]MCO6416177.1 OsmC family protein [Siccirubricoccus soli]MCP2682311.1 OsmC family protein [Siccirubricoccus soli]
MSTVEVRSALERTARIFSKDPAKARAASPAVTAVLENGLVCRISGPSGELRTDMPSAMGGGASAPSPGWLLRSAIASCTATVIAMRAAQLGIALDLLEVSVTSGGDARGMLGLDEAVSAAMTDLRTRVRIGAEGVPDDTLVELVRWAEAHAPVTCTIRGGGIQPVGIELR